MSKMKEASAAYCDRILSSRGHNYVAVVKFGSSASLACGFSDNADTLKESINSLYAGGGTDTAGGLQKAKETYEALGAANITEGNIIVISDGEPNSASDAQNIAKQMFANYNIYTIGYNLSGSAASFMQSIQNCGYYNVSSSQDIKDAIDKITAQILSCSSGNVNSFLANETVITVLENKKSPYSLTSKFVASENATVEAGGKKYTTDSTGTIQIPTVTSGTITVSKDGYIKKSVSAASINISGKVYLEKDEGDNPIINSVITGNVNVLYDEYEMDLTKDEPITVSADVVWKKGSYAALYLTQDSKRESFSGDKLTITLQDKFDISEDIYIVAIDSFGNNTKKKLLFTPNGNTPDFIQGFKFSMGGDMSFTLRSQRDFLQAQR